MTAITAAVVGVILNLAVWFALHTWFREMHAWNAGGLSFDVPVLPSINLWAAALSIAAAIAIFRFKAGMIPTLIASSAVGIMLHFARVI